MAGRAAEERVPDFGQPAGGGDMQVEQAGERQEDVHHLRQRHAVVDAAQPHHLGVRERQRRVGTKSRPLPTGEAAVAIRVGIRHRRPVEGNDGHAHFLSDSGPGGNCIKTVVKTVTCQPPDQIRAERAFRSGRNRPSACHAVRPADDGPPAASPQPALNFTPKRKIIPALASVFPLGVRRSRPTEKCRIPFCRRLSGHGR